MGNHVMTVLLLRDLADFHLFHGEIDLRSEEDQHRSITLYNEPLEMINTV